MAASDSEVRYLKNVPYSQSSSLNTLDLCLVDRSLPSGKLWIIYIHGGAWRDPRISSSSFVPTRDLLLSSPSKSHIAGLASLNYRLSPHPDFPSDDASRIATHPDHIQDVLTAIAFLQSQYGFGSKYILVGHSCGATLAFQVAMSRHWTRLGPFLASSSQSDGAVPPVAILGVEGIYDLPAMVSYHQDQPIYANFTTGAFGPQRQEGVDVWASSSPTASSYDTATWSEGRYVLLAHSKDDTLIEWDQVDLMDKTLRDHGWKDRGGQRVMELMELRGDHDEIWDKGNEMARAIELCVKRALPLL